MSYRDEILNSCIELIKSFENESLYLVEFRQKRLKDEYLQIHQDSADNLAIGYGLDLIVHSESELKKMFDRANQISSDNFDYEELNLFEIIQEYKKDRDSDIIEIKLKKIKLPSVEYANILFDIVAEDKFKAVKKIANTGTNKDYYSKLTKAEKSAIFSMSYNAGYGLFFEKVQNGNRKVIDFTKPYNCVKNLREYIDNKDSDKKKAIKARTRVWYEFRYNSCKEAWQGLNGGRGLAKRRYSEGDMFGLYDETIRSQKARWILDKLRDESIQKQGVKSIEKIAHYFEENIVSPDEVGEYRRVNDEVKGIEEIIKDLKEIASENSVEQIKAEIKDKGRKLDNVTEAFLKKYDEKYGLVLDKERLIYNNIIKIEEHTDLLIFPLMDRLVVSMEREAEKAKGSDGELYKSIKKFINRCKETLEEVINDLGGYKRTAYKQDNSQDLTDLERKKRLIAAFKRKRFNSPTTKKSHEFFKSFITKEDKEKERARKEAEEKKKREEERKKRAKEKEAKRKREAKKAERRRKEEREKARKREGWIVVQKLDGTESMSRKEYYGV